MSHYTEQQRRVPARTLEQGKSWLRDRLAARASPFTSIDADAVSEGIERLTGLDPQSWTSTWGDIAERYAAQANTAADCAVRRGLLRQAFEFASLARYPTPNHPLKEAAYARARELFAQAAALDEPPLEMVIAPFAGSPGEGDRVRFYLCRPSGAAQPPLPVVMMWGGIDVWKEEAYGRGRPFLEAGMALLLVDMPGVGESPVLAGPDAERQWEPVFEWIAAQPDLDAGRVGAVGLSYGGYWAMKLAHTSRDRLAAAVNWGGGVHLTFQPEWQERSRHASSYLMDLMAARARIFGGSTFEDYVARCPSLSLLDQGVLDRPCAPLLLGNGPHDLQNATDDIYLSLEHGDPKTARIFPGGHMGAGPSPRSSLGSRGSLALQRPVDVLDAAEQHLREALLVAGEPLARDRDADRGHRARLILDHCPHRADPVGVLVPHAGDAGLSDLR